MNTVNFPKASTFPYSLNADHYDELRASGISDVAISKLGHFSLSDSKEAKRITGIKHSGLVFEYWNPVTNKNFLTSKGKPFYRVKPDDWGDSSKQFSQSPPKYLSPPNEGNRPYWSKLIQDFKSKARKTSVPLEIVEGEKKADSLASEGFFVLGLAGVFGWLDKSTRESEVDCPPAQLIEDEESDQDALKENLEKSRILPELIDALDWKGRRVNIAFDSDVWTKPEVKAAAVQLATALQELGAYPTIVRLPAEIGGAKNGPDDFKVRHGIEAYRVLCKYALPAVKGSKEKKLNLPNDPNPLHKIFLAWSVLKDLWRYRPSIGWYQWDVDHWVLSNNDEFERSLTFFQDAQDWYLVKGMDLTIRQLRSRLLVPEKEWNSPRLLNFKNGTLDQVSGEFRPQEREDFCTTVLPYDYDQTAYCPTWIDFLNEALGNDQEVIGILQAFCKWILTPKARDRNAEIQKSLDLVGCKGSGKGTFLDTITSLVGPENTGTFKTKTFDNPNYLASLLDKKVSIDYDASGFLADTGTFNQIVSNEAVPIKVLFRDALSARLCTVVIRAYNRHIEVPDGSEGLDRRIIVVPFDYPPKIIDLDLSEKLKQELSGIFAWAWSIPAAEMKRRLNWAGAVPAVAEASIRRYEANNPEYSFLGELFPNGGEQIRAGALYASYQEWCKDSGINAKKLRKFLEAIQGLGCKKSPKSHGNFFYTIPAIADIDLIELMGLKREISKNAISAINTPRSSPTLPIVDGARVQLSPELSPDPSQILPQARSSPDLEQNHAQSSPDSSSKNSGEDLNLGNNRGRVGGESGGELDLYTARDGEEWGGSRGQNGWKTKKEDSIGPGDWVKYSKGAPSGAVKVSCSNHPLQVLDFRGKERGRVEALVKRDTWFEGRWILLEHLYFFKTGELPKPELTEDDIEDLCESGFTEMPAPEELGDRQPIEPAAGEIEGLELGANSTEPEFNPVTIENVEPTDPAPSSEQSAELNRFAAAISTAYKENATLIADYELDKYVIALCYPDGSYQYWSGMKNGFNSSAPDSKTVNRYKLEANASNERERIVKDAAELISPNWEAIGYKVRYNTVRFFIEKQS